MRSEKPVIRNCTTQRLLISGTALLAAMVSACGSPTVDLPTSGETNGLRGKKHSRPVRNDFRIIANQNKGRTSGSKALRTAYIKSVQAEANSEYTARPVSADTFHFDSRQQGLSAELGSNGMLIDVLSDGGRSGASFRLIDYGCVNGGGSLLPAVRPLADGTRVSYSRSNVVEWYQNGRLGIEQGFDLSQAPPCRAGGDAAIELKVEIAHSLRPTLMNGPDGESWLELRDGSGRLVLRYSDLSAEDANQVVLPTRMALAGNILSLRVDDRGARYPVRVDPLIWAQLGGGYKAASPTASDGFGFSVAVSDDHAVIGAPSDAEGGPNAGAAYVFQRDAQGVWIQQAKILGFPPLPGDPGGHFGWAVGIDDLGGDKRIVVGAPDDPGSSAGTGMPVSEGVAVWFRGRATSWAPEAAFADAGRFGWAVAASGGRVLVGGPGFNAGDGLAVLYEFDASLPAPPWAEVLAVPGAIGSGEQLGSGVGLSGGTVVLGAPGVSHPGRTNDGAAYVFESSPSGTWAQTATLAASDAASNDAFGANVSISGLTAAIGSPGKNSGAGGAYLFAEVVGTWGPLARLHTISGLTLNPGDGFGHSLSVIGNLIAIGAPGTSVAGNASAGAAYLFTGTGTPATVWSLTSTLTPTTPPPRQPLPAALEGFGSAVSLDRGLGHVLIGAAGNDVTATDSGAFYDFTLRKKLGDPCVSSAECASDACVDGVCCNSTCGGGSGQDCMACSIAMGATANGSCGAVRSNAGIVCRAAAGECDLVDTCDGQGTACPADAFRSALTVCRAATGGCDVEESCTGTSATCPSDQVMAAQTVCRAAAGECDMTELCNGQDKGCPADSFKPSATICRLKAGECDQHELCSGTSVACPADDAAVDNTGCSGGSCQAGVCRVEANLSLSMSGPAAVEPQQDLSYTLSITNFGPSRAQGVAVSVTLPPDASLSASAGSGAACQSVAPGVQCTLTDLDSSQTAQIVLLIHPPGQTAKMTIAATAGSSVFDPNLTNNSATIDQDLLSGRLIGGGAGCSIAVSGALSGGDRGSLLAFAALLLETLRRRRRAARS